jgi:hypothetical protein
MPTISQTTAAGQLARTRQIHLELAGELPTLDTLTGLVKDAEAMTGQSVTLADIVRATRDAVTNHADAQTNNALDIMRYALNRYEQTDASDSITAKHHINSMQAALDTLQKADALRI